MTPKNIARLLKFILLAPVLYWIYLIASDSLGADPAKTMSHKTGETAFFYLLANLSLGAGLSIFSARPIWARSLILIRRYLGVLTFVILVFHLVLYLALEGFEPQAFTQLYTKTYLILGTLAWFIFLILALTSNDFSMRRLGGRRWKKLHRMVYIAMALVSVHVMLIEKADLVKFGVLIGILWLIQGVRVAITYHRRSKV